MHWTVNGAGAIIALRCREASSTREAICNRPAHSDARRLTRAAPKMIVTTSKAGGAEWPPGV